MSRGFEGMDFQALAPAKRKRSRWWILITILFGIAGSIGAIAAFGKGTYTISPFKVEFRAIPSAKGETQLIIRPETLGVEPGHAEATTHKAPMTLRMTVLDVSGTLPTRALLSDPFRLADHLRFSDEGREAIANFGRKLGLLAAGGGLAGGLVVSLGRFRRVPGALLSGVLALGVIGLLVHQTYDIDKFRQARFERTSSTSASRR
jgi:hypothetical protein